MSDPLPTHADLVATAAKLLYSAVLASPPVMNPEQAMRLAELHLLLAAEVRQMAPDAYQVGTTESGDRVLPNDAPPDGYVVVGPWVPFSSRAGGWVECRRPLRAIATNLESSNV